MCPLYVPFFRAVVPYAVSGSSRCQRTRQFAVVFEKPFVRTQSFMSLGCDFMREIPHSAGSVEGEYEWMWGRVFYSLLPGKFEKYRVTLTARVIA